MSIREYKMKRIIIIFLIAVCLLSFMDIPYSAKESHTNFGELWLESSYKVKFPFTTGYMAGMNLWFIKLLPILTSKLEEGLLDSKERETVSKLIEFRYYFDSLDVDGFKNIINVVTDLYKDPANTYIPTYEMIEFAYRKLKGEDIEPLLQEARKKALT